MATEELDDNLNVVENDDGTVVIDGFSDQDEHEPASNAEEATTDEEEDSRVAGTDDSDDDDGETPTHDENGRELSKTEINRLRRQTRREQRRQREEQTRAELALLRQTNQQLQDRLSGLERRTTGSEVAQLDAEIKKREEAYRFYKEQIAFAGEQKDFQGVSDATAKMIAAEREYNELGKIKEQFLQSQNRPQQTLNPAVQTNVRVFMERNPWYNAAGSDADSQIVKMHDAAIAAEGYDAGTALYWQELERRLKKNLPHRYKSGTSQKPNGSAKEPPPSRVTGSARESGGSVGSGKSFTLSAERVQALKDAGMWDNLEARNRMIKKYREADRNQRGQS